MKLQISPYLDQLKQWPESGKVILAQYDAESVIVYQAYRPATAHFAVERGYFGKGFSYDRMSWIKPNFLWMMYRSCWGTKPNQEVTLAVRLKREAFDYILQQAVPSTFNPHRYASHEEWQQAVRDSEVLLQWDPDHDPQGEKVERRAIQLGLRGETLRRYGKEWIVEITDISKFVREQREFAKREFYNRFQTPMEAPYPVRDPQVAERLEIEL